MGVCLKYEHREFYYFLGFCTKNGMQSIFSKINKGGRLTWMSVKGKRNNQLASEKLKEFAEMCESFVSFPFEAHKSPNRMQD
jgi:hypothetical protein